MIKNYFKIAWRNLLKSKSFSLLNISGLSIGMACSILILLWVQNEISYDDFHEDSSSIFRLIVNSGDFKTAVSSAGMAADLAETMTEVASMIRTTKHNDVLFDVNNTLYEEKQFMYVDSNFLSFFNFPLLSGDKASALASPNTLVITESLAKKYFGDHEALGKTITLNNAANYTVTGVLKDLPSNSLFKFNVISSMITIAKTNNEIADRSWGNFNFYSYLKLKENISSSPQKLADFSAKVNAITDEKLTGGSFDVRLQPIQDIHLYSDLQLDVEGHGNVKYVNIFFIVAIFILIVACINFMNLSTARSAKRSKEVGLRKAVGAERSQLIIQFLSESILISLISLILAVCLVVLTLPFFNGISGKTLEINITDSTFWVGLLSVAAITGLFAGSYPALYLSGFNPVKVLKGNMKMKGGNLLFRNSLVVTQFVVSAVLIVGTAVVYQQLNYMKNKNLGFDKSNTIIMPIRGEMAQKREALENTLSQNTQLSSYSIFNDMPTDLSTGTTNISWEGKDDNDGLVVPNMGMDDKFVELFDIKVLAGRGFTEEFQINDESLVINETLMKIMGKDLSNIIGTNLSVQNRPRQIIGVVKDFHFKPLQYGIEPLFLEQREDNPQFLAVKTTVSETKSSLEALQKINTELNPAFPFSYTFLDSDLENLYTGEQQMGKIFNLLAVLAILISCLGIYGLSAFMAEQRTKEIGIRKVLGAETIGLVKLMSQSYLKLVFWAILIAMPLSWYYLNQWLSDFAYHISMSWWMFAVSGVIVMTIALLTVSYQSIKTAVMNPVDSLQSE